jgi:hypothetical protein
MSPRTGTSPELTRLVAEMRRAQIAFDTAGHDGDSPKGKPLFDAFSRAQNRLVKFKPRTVADVVAKLHGAELSYHGRRGEIKRSAREIGCAGDQMLAMVLTDLDRLVKGGAP